MNAARIPSKNIVAQNIFKVLGLIDRTILSRRLLLSNGKDDISLIVARQAAVLEDRAAKQPSGASLVETAAIIMKLCASDKPVTHRLGPFPAGTQPGAGYSAIALLNAQGTPKSAQEVASSKGYRFSKEGLPLTAPPGSSFASLLAAAQIAWAMSAWQKTHGDSLLPPTMILAVSDTVPEDVSVSVDGQVTITSTPPSRLGHLVSRWQNQGREN